MINTMPANRQLFVVKDIANKGLKPSEIPENTIGIIDEETNLTVKPASFASLPKEFRVISKFKEKIYRSFSTINKDNIKNAVVKEYKEPQVQKWKVVIDSCNCMKSAQLIVNLNEESLIAQDGLTWSHRDMVVEVSPKEFACYCSCEGNSVYENNVMTMLLYKQIQQANSPFYEAKVFVEGGNELEGLEAIQSFIDSNKAVNTDDDKDNDAKKLELHLEGKLIKVGQHRNLEPNYANPRGVSILPAVLVNDSENIQFEKIQDLEFEIGSGYDLKHEEFEIMGYYDNIETFRDYEGFENPELFYQSESDKKYDTLTFEFYTDKAERSEQGDKRAFMAIFATEHDGGKLADLKKMFVK